MELTQDVIDRLSAVRENQPYTEEEIRELMKAVEIPQFAEDERRVEFDMVPLRENGGAAYLKSDFRLTAVVPTDNGGGWYAIFMRMSPSAEELELMRFQRVAEEVLNATGEAFDETGDDYETNVIELFKEIEDA